MPGLRTAGDPNDAGVADVLDGVVYALLTGLIFAALWPAAS